jgi:hypothetical protein
MRPENGSFPFPLSNNLSSMKWFIAKMVYQIICGAGKHAPQFDEQLRLIVAENVEEALRKALAMGTEEQDSFLNQKNDWVRWKFINVSDLYPMSQLIDGAEIYSRIEEVDNADAYISFVHRRAEAIEQKHRDTILI